jgi:hypothetical protein
VCYATDHWLHLTLVWRHQNKIRCYNNDRQELSNKKCKFLVELNSMIRVDITLRGSGLLVNAGPVFLRPQKSDETRCTEVKVATHLNCHNDNHLWEWHKGKCEAQKLAYSLSIIKIATVQRNNQEPCVIWNSKAHSLIWFICWWEFKGLATISPRYSHAN